VTPNEIDLVKKIRDGFVAQGGPSFDPERALTSKTGGCMYRGPGGSKCAVGLLIDDAYYSPDLEGKAMENSLVLEAIERSVGRSLTEQEIYTLAKLQEQHDYNAEEPDFLDKMLDYIDDMLDHA
jgi:hypothetical protein